jgi:hypothetical protein
MEIIALSAALAGWFVHSLTLWLLSRGGAFSAVALLMP